MNMKAVGAFVAVTIGVLAGVTVLLWNFGNASEQAVPEVRGEMRHVRGEGEIVVTEFSDFQCPACAGVEEPLKEILSQYTGRVKLVYRHLPLPSIHKNALGAAVAAEAAGEQGKFWEFHDVLLAKQNEWEASDVPEELWVGYAKELWMEEAKFREDLGREDLKQIVLSDAAEAVKYKVQSTPSFFVEGERVGFEDLEIKLKQIVQ